jgi:hypothetical protein
MDALSRRRGDDLRAAGIALAVAAVLYPRAVFRGESFFERDLHLDWYPRIVAIARCLREGALPLWDPGVAFGHPLLADAGTQVVYPPAWLALLVPLGSAYTVLVLAHLVLASVATARLARALGAARHAALAASSLFVLSGPLQSAVNLWHHFAGACVMPLVLLAALRAAARPGRRTAGRLGLAGAFQALAGSADVCVMTWALAAGLGAWRASARPGRRRPALATLVLGALLAIAVSAVVWLPAADAVSRSGRRELPVDVRTAWSVPATGLLRVLAPLDPARVPFEPETWTRLYERPEWPLLYSLYLGPVALALGAFAVRGRPAAAPLALGAAVFLLAAMGPHGPLYEPLAAVLPPVRVFRYPSKALLVFALLTALLAGLGAQRLSRWAGPSRVTGLLAGSLLVAGAILPAVAARFGASGVAPHALLAAAGGLLALPAALRRAGRTAALALAALAAADLALAHRELNATTPSAFFAPPPLAAYAPRDGASRLHVYDYHTLPGVSRRLLGRDSPYATSPPAGMDPRVHSAAVARLYLVPPSAALYDIEGSFDLDIRGLFPRELTELNLFLRAIEGVPAHGTLLRMGGVGTVVTLHDPPPAGLEPVAVLPSLFPEPIRVHRVVGTPRRHRFVGCARVAAGADAFRRLVDPAFEPDAEVIVESRVAAGGACGPAGSVRLVSRRSDALRYEVEADRDGLLVVADAWDPGWRATVDGSRAEVLRANVAFRAVAVPAGRHAVEMVYRPSSAALGLGLTVLGLVSSLALVARATRRRASAGGAPSPHRTSGLAR